MPSRITKLLPVVALVICALTMEAQMGGELHVDERGLEAERTVVPWGPA